MADDIILISDRAGARMLGISRATWWRRVNDKTLPQPIKLGGATRWRRDEVLAAVAPEAPRRTADEATA